MSERRKSSAGVDWSTSESAWRADRLPVVSGLRVKLGLLAATGTAIVLAATAFFTIRFFHGQLLAMVTDAGSTESDALRVVLEEQMMAGDRTVIGRLVSDVGREPNIAWIGVLDEQGVVQVSSRPAELQRKFERSSPDCAVCHAREAVHRTKSVTLLHAGEAVLRTVAPLVNREACHQCHDPTRRLNGMLIIDRSLGTLQAAVMAIRTRVILGSAAVLLALLLTLGLAVEHLVLRRLRHLSRAAREFGRGDLTVRAAELGDDELRDLAHDFNVMAARLEAAVARLAADRRELEELLDGLDDGVLLLDPDLRVITANHGFAARLPLVVRAAAGADYAELVRSAGLEVSAATSPAARALATGGLEKAIVRLSGPWGERSEEIHAQVLHGVDGAVSGVVEVWRDVSDRLALEASLEQSERLAAVGMLASSVAHEVGNPLASIATAVEGLLRRMEQPAGADIAELRDYLEIVRKQVFRCHAVTARLLGFARVPSRLVTTVDAAAVAREAAALIAPQARAQAVELSTEIAEPARVIAEDLALEQALLNLVVNALQAMPSGGRLTIAIRQDGNDVLVSVADTGPGLSPQIRAHLFEPFLQAREKRGGTGLGLFLTHALINRCGGAISVASEPGRGATFTIRLKAAPAGVATAPAAAKRVSA